ncbi:MAG: hypothetical protein A3G34_08005 [Candidatus Lindowbacteria bacterium RIFCSPLOWO2_12_FULL_62_27]|nr:MAG: hypothetical protein A3G34_08005 [Candidatus Lindowbacteria bacterium RIFCSPLOWO2_12_FULL_62_27]OGH63597.1 MAG: hypothetical protein A3I06_14030 [Candidatus Lindowbacteria bacterium RIFCSPLOWO2_02_FULL_62_12]
MKFLRFLACITVFVALPVRAADVPDAREVILVVNRDSNDISFVSSQTREVVGKVHLADWANPHMAMFTMDGRKIVASGTRANKIFIIDYDSQKVTSVIDADFAPEHMDISHDNRFAYVGNIEAGTVSVIDLATEKEVRRIEGFVEPHNITFTPDGTKAYVANLGAHWVGVIDAKRHELVKRVNIPLNLPVTPNSEELLGEIEGIINVTLTRDGKFGYAADISLDAVAIIDARTDELVKVIQLQNGAKPWRAWASHDGRTMWVPNNGDETVSVFDAAKHDVIATLEAGPDMTGVNFGNGKAYVISSSSGFVYVYDLKSLLPKGRIFIGKNVQLETATTDPSGQKLYLCESRNHSLYEINTRTDKAVQIPDVGFFPWGSHMLNSPDNYCH